MISTSIASGARDSSPRTVSAGASASKRLIERDARWKDMLAVVDHQEQLPFTRERTERVDEWMAGLLVQTERIGHRP